MIKFKDFLTEMKLQHEFPLDKKIATKFFDYMLKVTKNSLNVSNGVETLLKNNHIIAIYNPKTETMKASFPIDFVEKNV